MLKDQRVISGPKPTVHYFMSYLQNTKRPKLDHGNTIVNSWKEPQRLQLLQLWQPCNMYHQMKMLLMSLPRHYPVQGLNTLSNDSGYAWLEGSIRISNLMGLSKCKWAHPKSIKYPTISFFAPIVFSFLWCFIPQYLAVAYAVDFGIHWTVPMWYWGVCWFFYFVFISH